MGRIIRELLEFIFESLPPLDEVMGFLVRVLVRVWNKVELSHMVTFVVHDSIRVCYSRSNHCQERIRTRRKRGR